jgi:hypothetical protein
MVATVHGTPLPKKKINFVFPRARGGIDFKISFLGNYLRTIVFLCTLSTSFGSAPYPNHPLLTAPNFSIL